MTERRKARDVMAEARGQMDWREWEACFDGILREGGWEWWSDRVIPAYPIRKILYSHGVPKGSVEQVINMVQSIGRKAGLPDRVIAKTFEDSSHLPVELGVLVAKGPGGLRPEQGTVTIFGYVELKTGKGRVTPEQRRWLDLASNSPGSFSLVARPEATPYLRKVLIG